MGCVIRNVHLEGAATRFIGLPDAAHLLCPLGDIPAIGKPSEVKTRTLWRLDVEPVWLHNRYFTVGGKLK